jgi:2-polyprenyl-3-methyl-5-hydroxy-6-metoxy-1,4-benzoquinol methylase
MLRPEPQPDWPASWQDAYQYDLKEVFPPFATPRGHGYAYRQRLAHTLSMVEAVTPPHAKVIDIAAAQGNFALSLAERGYDVTWNDLRTELAGYVHLKHQSGAISFLPGDVFSLSALECYDTVVITEIIEHVAHPDRFLAQVAKLLKPGGHIVMTTPNGEFVGNRLPRFSDCPDPSAFESVQFQPDGDGHIFLLHADEIEPMAHDAGLQIQSLHLFTTFLTAGRLRTEFLLHAMPAQSVRFIERQAESWPASLARRIFVQMAVCLRKPPLLGEVVC